MVSIEGLWTAEIFGLHGWENAGVLVLTDGHALGGGRNHYSIGTYSGDRGKFHMSLDITYHGPPRTLFGSSDKELSIDVEGQVEREEILGSVSRGGNPSHSLSFRMTKRGNMP